MKYESHKLQNWQIQFRIVFTQFHFEFKTTKQQNAKFFCQIVITFMDLLLLWQYNRK